MGGHKNWAALGLALALLTAGCGLPDPKVAVDSPSGESASTQTAQATEASAPAAGARPAADSAPAGRTAPTRPDVSLADVAGAWVPANCDLPRQKLVGGLTTKGEPGKGFLGKAGDMNTTISEPVDMAGLGYQQRLGSYRCHAGNVPWPETLVLIGADGELLASQDLSDISRTGYADVESMTVQGDKVQVTWVASEMPGANFEPVTYRMVFAYSAGKLTHTGASAPKPSSGGGGRSQVKDVSALDSVEFASPTGRIQCYMGDDSVDCSPPAELLNSGKVPSDAEVCPGLDVEVGAVSVGRQGTGAWQCAGGVTALPMPGQASTSWADDGYGTRSNDGQYVALPYGKSLKRGGFTCSSAQDGVTCKNSSGGGFTVNRSAATFF